MKEINLEPGGRPVFIEDLQMLAENASAIEKILVGLKLPNCVISGCDIQHIYKPHGLPDYKISQGAVFIDNRLRFVDETVLEAIPDVPLYIVADDKDSGQTIMYKEGAKQRPWFTDYRAKVRMSDVPLPNSIAMDHTDLGDNVPTINGGHNAFANFFTVYLNNRPEYVSCVDISNYLEEGRGMPEAKMYLYQGRFVPYKKLSLGAINEPWVMSDVQYTVFCCDDKYNKDKPFSGEVYHIFDENNLYQRTYESVTETVPAIILHAFNQNLASEDYAGAISPDMYKLLLVLRGFLSDGGIINGGMTIDGGLTIGKNGVHLSTDNGTLNITNTQTQLPASLKAGKFITADGNLDLGALALQLRAELTQLSKDAGDIPMKQDIIYGEIIMWAGSLDNLPQGYLLCDGTPYLVSEYPKLAKVIGHTFASPILDQSYFCVPDLRSRFVIGCTSPKDADADAEADGDLYKVGQTGGSPQTSLEWFHLPQGVSYLWSGSGHPEDFIPGQGTAAPDAEIHNRFEGMGQPFDTIPPYLALAYLIRAY